MYNVTFPLNIVVFTQEIHDGKGGKDPFPMLLKKTKLPKKWKEKPGKFVLVNIVVPCTAEHVASTKFSFLLDNVTIVTLRLE